MIVWGFLGITDIASICQPTTHGWNSIPECVDMPFGILSLSSDMAPLSNNPQINCTSSIGSPNWIQNAPTASICTYVILCIRVYLGEEREREREIQKDRQKGKEKNRKGKKGRKRDPRVQDFGIYRFQPFVCRNNIELNLDGGQGIGLVDSGGGKQLGISYTSPTERTSTHLEYDQYS